MKTDALRDSLIKSLLSLIEIELRGYIAYRKNVITLENPDYSEQKAVIMGMIEEENNKIREYHAGE